MSIPQAQENDPQILECMTPDSPMSESPLFRWARLSRDVSFARSVVPCTPATPGFLDFPVLSPLVPSAASVLGGTFLGVPFGSTHSHQRASEELHAHLHLVTPGILPGL